MTSAQMAGDGNSAIAAAEKLARVVSQDAGRSIAWVQPILVVPYFTHVQFSNPATALALPDPGDELPYVKAMWHYARGVAHAWRGEQAVALGMTSWPTRNRPTGTTRYASRWGPCCWPPTVWMRPRPRAII